MTSRRQYLVNILWSWLSAGTLIVNGALLSPYLIRQLGSSDYGVWALGISLVEYFWMIDLGVRPATVKLTAEYRALEKWDELNSLISTALAYSAAMGLLILALVSLNTAWIIRFFHITNPGFPLLLHVVSLSWAFGLVFNVFGAAVEGFQRFDVTNRIFVGFLLARTLALLAAVKFGYGVSGMSIGLFVTQFIMYASFPVALVRLYPGLRISPQRITKKAGREIWLYSRQVVSAMFSGRLLTSSIPALVARISGVRYVTYYSVMQKVMDYAGEGIGHIGVITAPRAADWMARGLRPQVIRLAEYGNKYCLTLWLVCATYLFVYCGPFFRVWYTPELASQAAILLPVMLIGQTFFLGQFVSAAILMGIGSYGEYSASLMVEAVVTVLGFALTLKHYGLFGGIAIGSTMIFLNRFVNLSRIFAKRFEIDQAPFIWRIYRWPVLLAVIDIAALLAVRTLWFPGRSLLELFLVGLVNTISFGAAAFWLVVEPPHREFALEKASQKLRALAGFRSRARVASAPIPEITE